MEEEIWKDVEGYKGLYQVSNLGRIKSLKRQRRRGHSLTIMKEKIFIPYISKKGYNIVGLCNNGIRIFTPIHRLVAKSFIPNPENKPQVNHKNGIKTDNRIENLEWVTNKENCVHSSLNNLCSRNYGEKNGSHKLNNKNVFEIRELYKTNKFSQKQIADMYNVTQNTIHRIVNNISWKY